MHPFSGRAVVAGAAARCRGRRARDAAAYASSRGATSAPACSPPAGPGPRRRRLRSGSGSPGGCSAARRRLGARPAAPRARLRLDRRPTSGTCGRPRDLARVIAAGRRRPRRRVLRTAHLMLALLAAGFADLLGPAAARRGGGRPGRVAAGHRAVAPARGCGGHLAVTGRHARRAAGRGLGLGLGFAMATGERATWRLTPPGYWGTPPPCWSRGGRPCRLRRLAPRRTSWPGWARPWQRGVAFGGLLGLPRWLRTCHRSSTWPWCPPRPSRPSRSRWSSASPRCSFWAPKSRSAAETSH